MDEGEFIPRADGVVGVFDSGVGGISVLRALVREMPREKFLYYGDSANAPYGEKSAAQVREIAESVTERLLSRGAKAVVIACNTATGAAATYLRDRYPNIPIIGMEPAVKPAATFTEHPTVLVMATALTLSQDKYRRLEEKYSGLADFIEVPCHGLVELIEAGVTEGHEMDALLRRILDPHVKGKMPDAVVLGCTHYIHAAHAIRQYFGAGVRLFEGAPGTARETARRLAEAGLAASDGAAGSVEIENSSGDTAALALSWELLRK